MERAAHERSRAGTTYPGEPFLLLDVRRRACLAAILLILLVVGLPSSLFAWASITGFKTHQYIVESACDLLKKEPVHQGSGFPECAKIVLHEGIAGPDGKGKSQYSSHYYNPRLPEGRRGKGPTMAGEEYVGLVEELLLGKYPVLTAKRAAYAEHYAADMNVPFHTNGCLKEDLPLYRSGYDLDKIITGSYDFCYQCFSNPVVALTAWMGYFKLSIENFNAGPAAAAEVDWFDPWFENAASHPEGASSHALWEGLYLAPLGSYLEGWDNFYAVIGNGIATFDNPWNERRKAVEYMAVESANWAADPAHLKAFHYGVNRSIRCVRTLWRAAMSGIRPDKPTVKEVEGGHGLFLKIANVEKRDDLRGVKARITLSGNGCSIERDAIVDVTDTIPRGGSWEAGKPLWVVRSPAGPCKAKIEVVGEYKEVPDLQYGVAEAAIPKYAPKITLKITQSEEAKVGGSVALNAVPEPDTSVKGMTLKWRSSPEGAIASSGGMSAFFVAPAPGTYTVEAILVDGSGEKVARAERKIPVGGGKVTVAISPSPAYFGKPVRIRANFDGDLPPGASDLAFSWREAKSGAAIHPRNGSTSDFTINAPEKPAKTDKVTYTLTATAVAKVNGVQREMGTGSGSVDFVAPLFSTIHVLVKSELNKPLTKATVAIRAQNIVKQTDASGKVDLDNLVPGEYTITAGAPGFAVENAPVRLDPKNEEDAQKGASLSITLRPSASFFATAVDKENPSKLIPSVTFRLKGVQERTLYGDNGTALFEHLAPGRYTIEATGPDNLVSDDRDMTLSPPDTGVGEQYVLYMYPAARVTAYILGEKTKNMDGQLVRQPEPGWISLDGKQYVFAGTGTALFEKVPRGRHALYGMATGYGTVGATVDVDPKVKAQYQVYIQLNPALTLRVEPRDPTGSIVGGASGVLRGQDKIYNGKSTTGGSILFTDLPPGRYSLLVRANGFKNHVTPSVAIETPKEEIAVRLEPAPSVMVSLSGYVKALVGQSLQIVPRISMSDGSEPPGNLIFRWTDNGQSLEKNGPIAVSYKQPGSYTVVLDVLQKDERGQQYRLAGARHSLFIQAQEAPKGAIALSGNDRIWVGQTAGLHAAVSNTTADRSLYNVFWYLNGRYAGSGSSLSVPGSAPGTYPVKAVLVAAINGNWYSIANAGSTISVQKQPDPQQPKPEAPRQTTVSQPKPDAPKTQVKQDQKPQVPSQPHQQPPRAWGQLTKDEQQKALDCLCRCNSSATSSVSVSYDPKPSNASPSCAKASNGPCINQGFGCWRHVPEGGSECAKNCYKQVNTTGAPDAVLKEGNGNGKDTEDAAKRFEACIKSEKDSLEGANKELARVGQKDAPSFFRCGPIGTNWQMIPSNTCCDPFRRDSEKNMDVAWRALQDCGWKEEITKRKAELDKKTTACQAKR